MERFKALIVIALLLVSPTVTSANANENVLHPNIIRAINDSNNNSNIEFIVQYQPTLTEEHLATAEGIGVEIISIFEFIDGFYGKATASQIKDLSRQDDIFWIEHNTQMEYYMQDTTRVINAVEAWQTVIIDEDENIVADQSNQHEYIDGTGVAAVIIDTGVDAGPPDFDYDEGKTV